jgi:MFS family permease
VLAFVARRAMPESDLWLRGGTRRLGAGLGRLLGARRFWLALGVTTVNGASYWLTYSWLPEYLRSRGLTLYASGRTLAVLVAGEIVGYAAFGWVSDRIGRRPAFTAFALTMAAGLVPLTLWQQAPSLLMGAAALVGIGTGTWSNFGPMLSELFATDVRNSAMGAVLNLSRAAQLVAPVAIARLEPRLGLAAGTGLASGFAALAALLIWTLPETRARRL